MLSMAANVMKPISTSLFKKQTHKQLKIISCLSTTSSSNNNNNKNPRKLILYSKPGCCLCDGLKDKLNAAFTASDTLRNVELEVRDISTDIEWQKAYEFEIPVLAKLRLDGTQETLPRLSPRLSVELIEKKIADVFRD